ncbi:MAG: hypothetical protein PsegKO_17720 [Pseudohongiellaceae bacterium]
MSIDITFTLRDDDLNFFRDLVSKAIEDIDEPARQQAILDAAADVVESAQHTEVPGFIAERISILETFLNMLRDEEWQLGEEERKSIIKALSYFSQADDLIPDNIPGIGFLDDALYAEILAQEMESELRTYNEFCQYRLAEELRRSNRGLNVKVGREDWLADKRSVLHSRMRARRGGGPRGSSRGWRTGLF